MARKESKRWLEVISELSSINKPSNSTVSCQSLVSGWGLLEDLESTPALPRTTWETLVNTTQVSRTSYMSQSSAGKAQRLESHAAHVYAYQSGQLKAPNLDCMGCSYLPNQQEVCRCRAAPAFQTRINGRYQQSFLTSMLQAGAVQAAGGLWFRGVDICLPAVQLGAWP
jgi:hypothetical protein